MNKKVINKKKERDSEKDVRSGKKDATENPDISVWSFQVYIFISYRRKGEMFPIEQCFLLFMSDNSNSSCFGLVTS